MLPGVCVSDDAGMASNEIAMPWCSNREWGSATCLCMDIILLSPSVRRARSAPG